MPAESQALRLPPVEQGSVVRRTRFVQSGLRLDRERRQVHYLPVHLQRSRGRAGPD